MSKDLIGYFSCDPETGAPVWDEGCVCGDNIFSVEGTGTVGRPIKFADTSVSAEPVAYLDLGAGGYMDVGTDLTDEQLAALPKGRHMLAIVGTYGVEGFTAAPVAAQAQQVEPTCYVRPAATIATLNGYTVCPKGEGIPVYAHPPTQAQPKPRKVERTSDFSVELRFGSCREASEFERKFQQVDGSPETQGKPVDESPILQGQQQPASNADGLPLILHDLNTSAGGRGFVAEYFESRVGRYDFTRYICDRLAADFACALAAHLSQQDVLQAEVLDMVRMLEANEWADHCGQSELGKRLEWAITALQNRPQNIPEIIPEPAQQDADKVDAEQWISVNERLPEIHEWRAGSIAGISDAVLTIDEDAPDTMTVQHLRKGGQGDLTTLYWDHGDSPTHWRPAPSLPGIDAARKEQV